MDTANTSDRQPKLKPYKCKMKSTWKIFAARVWLILVQVWHLYLSYDFETPSFPDFQCVTHANSTPISFQYLHFWTSCQHEICTKWPIKGQIICVRVVWLQLNTLHYPPSLTAFHLYVVQKFYWFSKKKLITCLLFMTQICTTQWNNIKHPSPYFLVVFILEVL